MRNGIVGSAVNAALKYAPAINTACNNPADSFSPLVAYAIAWRETIRVEVSGWLVTTYGPGTNALNVISGDGGHGLFQLTSSYPDNWQSAYINALYAKDNFLVPAETYWATLEQGESLVKCIAAEFNAGRDNAIRGHDEGDVDKYTSDGYGAAVLGFYRNLVAHGSPA